MKVSQPIPNSGWCCHASTAALSVLYRAHMGEDSLPPRTHLRPKTGDGDKKRDSGNDSARQDQREAAAQPSVIGDHGQGANQRAQPHFASQGKKRTYGAQHGGAIAEKTNKSCPPHREGDKGSGAAHEHAETVRGRLDKGPAALP